jgi:hypothetical protein
MSEDQCFALKPTRCFGFVSFNRRYYACWRNYEEIKNCKPKLQMPICNKKLIGCLSVRRTSKDKTRSIVCHYQMVRSEIMPARFRNSSKTRSFWLQTNLEFRLQDVLHTFKKGHKIQIQIQSTLNH